MQDRKILSTASAKASALLPVSTRNSISGIYGLINFVYSNLELPTVLSIGMFLQIIAFAIMPRYVAALPAIILLTYKIMYANPRTIAENWYLNGAKLGRHSAQVPNNDGSMPEKAGANGVVCFIVGNQVNQYASICKSDPFRRVNTLFSPLGPLAPGFKTVGDYFFSIYDEAERDPEKWGCGSRSAQFQLVLRLLTFPPHLSPFSYPPTE